MKLSINQVAFVKEALNSLTIPSKEARAFVEILDIVDKEFTKLLKQQETSPPNIKK